MTRACVPARLVAALITLGLLITLPAAAARQPSAIEEVIVTVTKREETTLDIPIAVTAFTAADIEAAGIRNIEDLALLAPGFTFTPIFGGDFSVPVIRGMSTSIGEPNVGFFVDGIYQSSRSTMTSLLGNFIERVEIAKGPQSVLYGRNTLSGAINYVTRKPADEFEARLEATAGSDGNYELAATASGALVPGQLHYRAAASWSELDGYFRNRLSGKHLDDRSSRNYFGSLVYSPAESLSVDFRVMFEDTDDGDDPLKYMENNAAFLPPLNDFQMFRGELPGPDTKALAVTPGFKKREHLNLALKIAWDLGPVTVTSITGFNDLAFRRAVDSDYEARSIRYERRDLNQEEFSQELRAQSDGLGPLHWMVGMYLYFLDADTDVRDEFVGLAAALAGLPNAPSLFTRTREETDEYSLFGQIGFDFTRNLNVTFGARWFIEEKSARATDEFIASGVTQTFDDKLRFDEFTPQLNVKWRFHESHMLYGSLARSVKAGGFNVITTTGRILPDERTFDPEDSWHQELGLKSRWFDDRLETSVAGYKIQWDDQIVRALGQTFAVLNANAAKTSVQGVELEFTARPTDDLLLRGGVAFTDSRFDRYNFGALAQLGLNPILDDTELQWVSEWTANLSAQHVYRSVFGAVDWVTRIDVAYQDEQSTIQTADAVLPDRVTVNLRAGLDADNWSLTVWVDNLLDDDAPVAGVFTPNRAVLFDVVNGLRPGNQIFQGLVTAQNPRAWGVTARYRF